MLSAWSLASSITCSDWVLSCGCMNPLSLVQGMVCLHCHEDLHAWCYCCFFLMSCMLFTAYRTCMAVLLQVSANPQNGSVQINGHVAQAGSNSFTKNAGGIIPWLSHKAQISTKQAWHSTSAFTEPQQILQSVQYKHWFQASDYSSTTIFWSCLSFVEGYKPWVVRMNQLLTVHAVCASTVNNIVV